ncbi:MAG: ubiquitin-like domain-containing protein [Actinomycetota bacterium]|nr:ubiquitin-like domain-containing protein [Actinomycetota bacterium]
MPRLPRLSPRRVLYPLVLLALLAGSVGWVSFDKTVTVSVDGHPRQVRTFAGTVGGVLSRAGLRAGPHDSLTPAASASVRDGSRIVLDRGRQITLSVDGQQRAVWVTARSVDEALGQLGVRADGAWLSASRSRAIPDSGLELAIRLPHTVTVAADGSARAVVTTAATVADLLTEAGVALEPTDTVSVGLGDYPGEGLVVTVIRVRSTQVTEQAPVAFETVRTADPGMSAGTERTGTAGVAGMVERVFAVTTTDGAVTSRTLVSERVSTPPQAQVVFFGTREVPPPSPAPAPSEPVASAPRPTSSGGLNWAALAQCESGGDPHQLSSGGTYRGLYQFTFGTWASVGGSGDPAQASSAEQTHRAQLLFDSEGRSPWPVCGKYL